MNVITRSDPPTTFREAVERDLSRGTGDLPVLPRAAETALRLAQSPNFDFDEVVAVAESDPPLAARFLGVANSALYYRGTLIRSIKAAVVRLGMQATRDVLYMAVYSGTVFKVPLYRDLVEATFHHSVVVARMTRRIAELEGADPETAFLAGLLHDVGRARLFKLAARRRAQKPTREEVLEAIDALHAEAGAALARAWHLPDEVVEACLYHHTPEDRPMALRVAAANRVAYHVFEGDESALGQAAIYLEKLGFTGDAVERLLTIAREDAALVKSAPRRS